MPDAPCSAPLVDKRRHLRLAHLERERRVGDVDDGQLDAVVSHGIAYARFLFFSGIFGIMFASANVLRYPMERVS